MDVFGLMDGNILKQVFLTNGTTNSWQVWEKPKNCKFVNILIIGGGGGGGAGFGAAFNTATGGGGGGSSAVTKGFFQANLLPDRLYIQVGPGGAGGTNNPIVAATAGSVSYVSIQPNTTAGNVILASGQLGGGAGGPGTGAAGGTAGATSPPFIQATFYLSTLGIVQSIGGQSGNAGGANTPIAVTIAFTTSGGAGGGGVTAGGTGANGANVTGAGFVPTAVGGGTSVVAIGGTGDSGFQPITPTFNSFNRYPLFTTGGAGGGASILAIGGTGGNGGYGSGGGGGGGSYISATSGGPGGRGGDGIVIITAW